MVRNTFYGILDGHLIGSLILEELQVFLTGVRAQRSGVIRVLEKPLSDAALVESIRLAFAPVG